MCILCGEEVDDPLPDEAFALPEFNAHQDCWDKYTAWMKAYKKLHNKDSSN
jgi:hypothetical protein